MANWNNPTNSSGYTNVLTEINDRINSTVKWDLSADTNRPTNAVQYSSASHRWQTWNGGSWVTHDIHSYMPDKTGSETISGSWTWSADIAVSSDNARKIANSTNELLSVNARQFRSDKAGGVTLEASAGLVAYKAASGTGHVFYIGGAQTVAFGSQGSLDLKDNSPGTISAGGCSIYSSSAQLYVKAGSTAYKIHPTISSFTPTFTPSGGMTYSTGAINYNYFVEFGNVVFWYLSMYGTTSGSAANVIKMAAPSGSFPSGSLSFQFICQVSDSGGFVPGKAEITGSSEISIYKADLTNFGLGAGRSIAASGMYIKA